VALLTEAGKVDPRTSALMTNSIVCWLLSVLDSFKPEGMSVATGTRLARGARFGLPMRLIGHSIENANILSASIRA
jgi:hypothetical protein